MFEFFALEYDERIESILKISDKSYKIKTKNSYYFIKEVKDDSLDKVYNRLLLTNINNFVIPLKGNNHKFTQFENEKYYIVSQYYEDEPILGHDIRISFYIRIIANLHKQTSFSINVQDNYLETTLNYLDNQIKKISNDINSRIEVIENSDYHSPNDWYFLMNYSILQRALESASNHVLNFENGVKEQKELTICLTYQNFDFSHVILNSEKIVSLEKVGFNLAPYDLYDLINKIDILSFNIVPFLKEYLQINPLKEYEKEYLMALLYTFDYTRYASSVEDLDKMIRIVEYIKTVNIIENDVIFASPSEE